MLYQCLRSILFLLPAEKAHHFSLAILKILYQIQPIRHLLQKKYTIKNEAPSSFLGLNFKNKVGLAAGFDKNAEYIDVLAMLGFGFIEIGTVTPLPQPGNPKPRLFRLKKDTAIINRMGFNNHGVEKVVERLKQVKDKSIIIGGNIGKNKLTPNEKAVDDYLICFQKLFDHVHYFVVNISSPNTPGLRDLQEKEPLKHILSALQAENNKHKNRKPILLKIAPDLTNSQLDDIIEIVTETKIDGIIATNTTVERKHLKTNKKTVQKIGAGGLSGAPLKNKSNEVLSYIVSHADQPIPIIAVGGILSADDAIQKINLGASMVQLYTGFIYKGPSLVKAIRKALLV